MENANSTEYLEKIKNAVVENLKKTAAPSVQMQDVPRQSLGMTDEDEAELDDLDEDQNRDARMTQRRWDKHVARDDEFEESDDEEMAEANGVYQTNGKSKSIMDHKNPDAPDDFSRPPSPGPRRIASPEPEIEEVDTNEGDETMEDIEAQVPEEPATEKKAEEAEPAPQDVAATTKVDNEGDVDMTEAAEPSEAPAIKEEEADAQPSAATEDPTTANDEPSDKVVEDAPMGDQPVEPTSDAQEAPKAPVPVLAVTVAEEPETAKAPASPEKPVETTDTSNSKTVEAAQSPDGEDKTVDGEKPAAPAAKGTED